MFFRLPNADSIYLSNKHLGKPEGNSTDTAFFPKDLKQTFSNSTYYTLVLKKDNISTTMPDGSFIVKKKTEPNESSEPHSNTLLTHIRTK